MNFPTFLMCRCLSIYFVLSAFVCEILLDSVAAARVFVKSRATPRAARSPGRRPSTGRAFGSDAGSSAVFGSTVDGPATFHRKGIWVGCGLRGRLRQHGRRAGDPPAEEHSGGTWAPRPSSAARSPGRRPSRRRASGRDAGSASVFGSMVAGPATLPQKGIWEGRGAPQPSSAARSMGRRPYTGRAFGWDVGRRVRLRQRGRWAGDPPPEGYLGGTRASASVFGSTVAGPATLPQKGIWEGRGPTRPSSAARSPGRRLSPQKQISRWNARGALHGDNHDWFGAGRESQRHFCRLAIHRH